MKSVLAITGLIVCFTAGFVLSEQREADARKSTAQVTVQHGQTAEVLITEPEAEPKKRCSFSSDCSHGKCKSGKCGGCSFSSDCKGWGKCKSGWCGGCSFKSDCKGFGDCRNGRCTKSPY